jgi:IQ domain-containing protein H
MSGSESFSTQPEWLSAMNHAQEQLITVQNELQGLMELSPSRVTVPGPVGPGPDDAAPSSDAVVKTTASASMAIRRKADSDYSSTESPQRKSIPPPGVPLERIRELQQMLASTADSLQKQTEKWSNSTHKLNVNQQPLSSRKSEDVDTVPPKRQSNVSVDSLDELLYSNAASSAAGSGMVKVAASPSSPSSMSKVAKTSTVSGILPSNTSSTSNECTKGKSSNSTSSSWIASTSSFQAKRSVGNVTSEEESAAKQYSTLVQAMLSRKRARAKQTVASPRSTALEQQHIAQLEKQLQILQNPSHPQFHEMLSQRYGIAASQHDPASQNVERAMGGNVVTRKQLQKKLRETGFHGRRAARQENTTDAKPGLPSPRYGDDLADTLIARTMEPASYRAQFNGTDVPLTQFDQSMQDGTMYAEIGTGAPYTLSDFRADEAKRLYLDGFENDDQDNYMSRSGHRIDNKSRAKSGGRPRYSRGNILSASLTSAMDPTRNYGALMDAYSLHNLLYRSGDVISTTPEFISFRRKYTTYWHFIEPLLRSCVSLLLRWNVHMAYISGERLAELAAESASTGVLADKFSDLTSCLVHPEDLPLAEDAHSLTTILPLNATDIMYVSKLIAAGDRFHGSHAETNAAIVIQSLFRMHRDRRAFYELKNQNSAAHLIQKCIQSWRARRVTAALTRQKAAQRRMEWEEKVQRKWMNPKCWASVKSQTRVIVHIPSIQRSNFEVGPSNIDIMHQELAQVGRICDITDPNVVVVMVSPVKLQSDCLTYWKKLLRAGGTTNTSSRIHIVVPEFAANAHPSRAADYSLAQRLLYSPASLNTIRNLTRGRTAYIVPALTLDAYFETEVAQHLNLPIFSALPEILRLSSSKSEVRHLLDAAAVPCTRGVEDVKGAKQFFISTATLLIEQPWTKKWWIRMNDDVHGHHTVIFDYTLLAEVTEIMQEVGQIETEVQVLAIKLLKADTVPEALSYHFDRIHYCFAELVKVLRQKMGKAVLPCWNEASEVEVKCLPRPQWRAYLKRVAHVGGTIEAVPDNIISFPVVNMCVEPNGVVHIESSHDQIVMGYANPIGATFPSCTHRGILHAAAITIAKTCFRRGIIGHIQAQFVVHANQNVADEPDGISEDSVSQRMFALDIQYGMSPLTALHRLYEGLRQTKTTSTLESKHLGVPRLQAPEHGSLSKLSKRTAGASDTVAQSLGATYAAIHHVLPPSLRGMSGSIGRFFKMCRLHNVAFNLRERRGIAFTLYDNPLQSPFGVISVSRDQTHALKRLYSSLGIFGKVGRSAGGGGGSTPESGKHRLEHTRDEQEQLLLIYKRTMKAVRTHHTLIALAE